MDVVDLETASPALAWEVVTSGPPVVDRDDLAVHAFLLRARHPVDDEMKRTRMILLASVPPFRP